MEKPPSNFAPGDYLLRYPVRTEEQSRSCQIDRGMRAEELDVRGSSAISDRPTTNGESCPPLWTNESVLHESAPRALRKAFAAGDQDEGWKAWRRHLQRRKRPISPTRIYPGGSMLAWGLPIEPSPELGWLLKQLGPGRDRRRAAREKLAALWRGEESSHDHPLIANSSDHIEHSNGNAGHYNGQLIHPHHLAHVPLTTHGSAELAEVHSPLTCLAWLHLLVIRPELFSPELWWQVCSRLLEVAQEQGARLESDPLGHQLWAGELPLTLAALLPELNPCRDLRGPATAALTLGIAEILDGEGLPHSRYLDVFQPLVACWSRSRLIAGHFDGGCWNEAAEAQFPLALREAVRLNFGSGIRENSAWVETRNSHRFCYWLSDLVQDLTTDKPTRRLIHAVVGKRRTRDKLTSKPQRLPAPAVHSEWAELAILRTDWSRRGASSPSPMRSKQFAYSSLSARNH